MRGNGSPLQGFGMWGVPFSQGVALGCDAAAPLGLRVRGVSFQHAPAFLRESVFLKAAVGFFGDGPLDEAGGEGGQKIQFFEIIASFEAEFLHDSLSA